MGDQPVARDAAVGRFEADDPAQRGRLPDRAAGVGAERHRRQPAATAAADPPLVPAGNPIERPRVARRSERRVLVRRAHRKLVAVRFADDRPRRRARAATRRSRRRAAR